VAFRAEMGRLLTSANVTVTVGIVAPHKLFLVAAGGYCYPHRSTSEAPGGCR